MRACWYFGARWPVQVTATTLAILGTRALGVIAVEGDNLVSGRARHLRCQCRLDLRTLIRRDDVAKSVKPAGHPVPPPRLVADVLDHQDLDAVVKKLKKVTAYLSDHLRHPERTHFQRQIALGRAGIGGLHGDLPKLAAIAAAAKTTAAAETKATSFLVEAIGKGKQRYRSGVTLGTREEAQTYIEFFARHEVPD